MRQGKVGNIDIFFSEMEIAFEVQSRNKGESITVADECSLWRTCRSTSIGEGIAAASISFDSFIAYFF
jgi:hypothetical protein